MFRHSTKQNVRTQDHLRKVASKALDKDRQILCDSVYTNTYDTTLPEPSVSMLDNVVVPLTGCSSSTSRDTRLIHTIALFDYQGMSRVRMCFLQPEVSSATAVTSSSYAGVMNNSRASVAKELNNPSLGTITASKEKCQIAGRLSPYIVERSGLSQSVTWSYFNASKSRMFYCVSSPDGYEMMSMTKETISLYQSFADPRDCAMVYVSSMKCFKVTASPEETDINDNPNKSTCIFLYCDGTFKVLGTPEKSYKVCMHFRRAVIGAHSSSMGSAIYRSLVPFNDVGTDV